MRSWSNWMLIFVIFKVLEADHALQMDDLRKQLERLSTENAKREEYVRIGRSIPARGFPLSSLFVQTDISFYLHLSYTIIKTRNMLKKNKLIRNKSCTQQ